MAQVEQLIDDIYRMEGRIRGANAPFAIYFIKDGQGAVIEPGPAALVPEIVETTKGLGILSPKYIIPTHIHLDHAGGVGRLAEVFPDTKIVVNREGAKHTIDTLKLIRSTRMAFGDDFESVYGPILAVPEERLKIVTDGDRLKVGGHELLIVHTPGHAGHHISIFDSKTKGLFAGEALGLIYSPGYPPLPAVAPPSFDMELYLRDMENLKALKPKLIFYSHGTVADEPEKLIDAVIKNTRLVGDFIMGRLRAGEKEEAIINSAEEYLRQQFGATLDEYELQSNVKGYIHYFRKKGLV
jgi:glyoxylase-like metal-dependent hydrolase (beta-lactamase superfamily II)